MPRRVIMWKIFKIFVYSVTHYHEYRLENCEYSGVNDGPIFWFGATSPENKQWWYFSRETIIAARRWLHLKGHNSFKKLAGEIMYSLVQGSLGHKYFLQNTGVICTWGVLFVTILVLLLADLCILFFQSHWTLVF